MAWRSNARLQERDKRDTGVIHLFDLEESIQLTELSRKTFMKLCRKGKVKPVSGRGEDRQYSYLEINRINELKKLQKDWKEPKPRASQPGYSARPMNVEAFYKLLGE